jgi:predicted NBD/HSP70 family sugar kinase
VGGSHLQIELASVDDVLIVGVEWRRFAIEQSLLDINPLLTVVMGSDCEAVAIGKMYYGLGKDR